MRQIFIGLFFFTFILGIKEVNGQCATPGGCTAPACNTVSGATNITVNSGEAVYVTGAYTGTITLNGGSVYVQSGVTFATGTIANTTATGGTINNCSVNFTTTNLTGFNNLVTLNNSASITRTFNVSFGTVNNSSSSGTLTFNSGTIGTLSNTGNASITVNGTTAVTTFTTSGTGTYTVAGTASVTSLSSSGANATVTMSGGTVGSITTSAKTTVNVSGGTLTSLSNSGTSSTLNLSGGTIGTVSNSGTTSTINASGSTITTLSNTVQSTVAVTSGTITSLSNSGASSTMSVNGGTINIGTFTNSGAGATLTTSNSFTITTLNNSGSSANFSIGGTGTVSTLNNSGATSTVTTSGSNITVGTVNNNAGGAGSTFNLVEDKGFTFNNNNTIGDSTSLNVSGNPNGTLVITNAANAKLKMASSGTIQDASTITNSGYIKYTSSLSNLVQSNGVKITNNSGATFNSTNTSNSSGSLRLDNRGTVTIAASGFTYQGASVLNNYVGGKITFSSGEISVNVATINNYGTMTVYDFKNNGNLVHMHGNSLFNITHQITTVNNSFDSDGCAVIDVSGASTAEFSGGNTNVTADPDVNFCGKVPYKVQDTDNITAATNTSPIHITVSTNTNGKIVNGLKIYILGATGNTAINGYWTVANLAGSGPYTFDLVGSTGNGVFAGSAVVYPYTFMGAATYLGYSNCSNPCPPLPVKFSYFNAIKEDNHVRLVWGTASEENNKMFIIQRSTNGIDFENIGFVNGGQDSHGELNYIEYDYAPHEGMNYYRIKQIDWDGISSFSNISAVKFINDGSWSVYPNPASGSFTISSGLDGQDEEIKITLIDITGQVVGSYTPTDYSNIEIQVSDLARGMYIVNIQTAGNIISKKIVLQ